MSMTTLNNGSTPLLEVENMDGFAAVNTRDTNPNVRQTAEEIWKKAMESVLTTGVPNVSPTISEAKETTEPTLSLIHTTPINTAVAVSSPISTPTPAPIADPISLSTQTPTEPITSETIRTKTHLGRLRRITLTEVWQNDVASFAEWVQNSLDLLGEAIALPTTETTNGVPALLQNAVIECQLGESHHESLVKLLTEIAGSNAKLAVWVVERAKAEHLRVIQWLNQSTQTRFYLVKVDAVRIEDSVPAPFYTPIVIPGK